MCSPEWNLSSRFQLGLCGPGSRRSVRASFILANMIKNITVFTDRLLRTVAVLSVLTSCTQAAVLKHAANQVSDTIAIVPIVKAINLSNQRLQQVPITFGQPFHTGAIPRGDTVVAYFDGETLPTQADIKARNPDGSARHAILTVLQIGRASCRERV